MTDPEIDNKIRELIGVIASENGILLDKNDPILVQVTIWIYLCRKLQDTISEAQNSVIDASLQKFESVIDANLTNATQNYETEIEKYKDELRDDLKQTANKIVKSAVEYLNRHSLIEIKKELKQENQEIRRSIKEHNYSSGVILAILLIQVFSAALMLFLVLRIYN